MKTNPNQEEIDLAKQIYALKVVLTPSWDKQGQARDALIASTHFFIALAAEKGETESPEEDEPESEEDEPEPDTGKEAPSGSPHNKTTQKIT